MSADPWAIPIEYLKREIENCEFRACMTGETSVRGTWNSEADRLKRILRQRSQVRPEERRPPKNRTYSKKE